MAFLRPYLQCAASHSNEANDFKITVTRIKEELTLLTTDTHQQATDPLVTDTFQQADDSRSSFESTSSVALHSLQHSRKRSATQNQNNTQADKVRKYLSTDKVLKYDDTELIFLGYARTVNNMSAIRKAKVKCEIAKIIMKAEIEQCTDDTNTVNKL